VIAAIDYSPYNYGREYGWTIDTPERGYEYGYCKTWDDAAREIAWRKEAARLGIPTCKPDTNRWDVANPQVQDGTP
jgi:hypothetical protein